MIAEFEKVVRFVLEVEKLKGILRKSRPLIQQRRYENSAEHSWQVALLAQTLAPLAASPVDTGRVTRMLIIHDIVEIDTGDKIIYSDAHDDYEKEREAAGRIFGILPETIAAEYRALWEEFEARETPDAKFARAMDRLMPVLQNIHNQGQTWVENNITIDQVLQKNEIIASAHPQIWQWVRARLEAAVEQGYLKAGRRDTE